MIRARESLDRWAHAAHDVLDQAQRNPMVPGHQINWALAYLGDRAGNAKVPSDIRAGYDASGKRVFALGASA
jgi:hypothetical protein